MKNPPALIITHNPTQDLKYHLDMLYKQFDQIMLVDNASKSETRNLIIQQTQLRDTKLKAILNDYNCGVATALNQGFTLAMKLGYDHIIALDQDSIPAPGMIEEMLSVYETYPEPDNLAVIAPKIEDLSAGIITRYLRPKGGFFFERKGCTEQVLEDVSIAITSGSLYNLKIYQKVGPFRDDFFIDYVDTEYCLRTKRRGYDIIVACNARLLHKLGNQQKIQIGMLEVRPTFHSATRWYYISRNRIPMFRAYGFHFPHWLLYEFVIDSYGFLRMLLFEDHKMEKILAVLLGCVDGLLGRLGEIPASREALLAKME